MQSEEKITLGHGHCNVSNVIGWNDSDVNAQDKVHALYL